MSREKVLEIQDLSKHFGGVKAVDNFSMEVFNGEIVGLIGPNGAGKTTLINVVTGFLTPDKGRVVFLGEDVTGLPPHKINSRGMARTFQLIKPFANLRVLDAIAVGALSKSRGKKEAYEKATEIVRLLGLKDPYRVCSTLTIVEEKLVELGRALATRPKLLLIDELAAGLRPHEIVDMRKIITAIRKEYDMSMVVVEHVMPLVMGISDRVVVMSSGAKIAEGTPEEIAKDPKVIAAYLGERRRV